MFFPQGGYGGGGRGGYGGGYGQAQGGYGGGGYGGYGQQGGGTSKVPVWLLSSSMLILKT